MNTSKLKEALEELKSQRAIIDSAINNLHKIIVSMNGTASPEEQKTVNKPVKASEPLSYVDMAVTVLNGRGKPMTAKELTFAVGKLKGEEVKRNSFEATLFKHMKNVKKPRIEKVGPAVYALPHWKPEVKDLWTEIIKEN